MERQKDIIAETAGDAMGTQRRVAFIKGRVRAKVRTDDEEYVMTVPNLVIREIIAFEIMVVVLALMSLLFNAPLEWVANPEHTPNPAKAPWYFLGLQELLHYFPPIVAGVLLPALVVIALIVIPYFPANIRRERLWGDLSRKKLFILLASVGAISIVLLMFSVWAILIPTWIITGLMTLPYLRRRSSGALGWLGTRSLSWWIMTWFVVITVVLTLIGTLFRGPEWSWTWPWKEIY